MIIFVNGKQKRIPRPPMIEGLTVEEFLERNAPPLWWHQQEMWESMPEPPIDDHPSASSDRSPPGDSDVPF